MTRLMSALSRAFASPSIIVAMLLVPMVAQERQAVTETSFLFAYGVACEVVSPRLVTAAPNQCRPEVRAHRS
jgi:hypothetical protein